MFISGPVFNSTTITDGNDTDRLIENLNSDLGEKDDQDTVVDQDLDKEADKGSSNEKSSQVLN